MVINECVTLRMLFYRKTMDEAFSTDDVVPMSVGQVTELLADERKRFKDYRSRAKFILEDKRGDNAHGFITVMLDHVKKLTMVYEANAKIADALLAKIQGPAERDYAKKTFPAKGTFDTLETIPSALREFKRWSDEENLPLKNSIRKLRYILPQQLKDILDRTEPEVLDSKFESWDLAVAFLTKTAGGLLGNTKIEAMRAAVTIVKGDSVLEKYTVLENSILLDIHVSEDPSVSRETAWQELNKRLPSKTQREIKQQIPFLREGLKDIGQAISIAQNAFDKWTEEDKSGMIGAISKVSLLFSPSFESSPIELMIDSGAAVSVIGAQSQLGLILAKRASTAVSQSFNSPLTSNPVEAVWKLDVPITLKYQNVGEQLKTAVLSATVYGIKNSKIETLLIGRPEMKDWGVIVDGATGRFGISSLKDEKGTPWFPNPSFSDLQRSRPLPKNEKGNKANVNPLNKHQLSQQQAQGVPYNKGGKGKGNHQQPVRKQIPFAPIQLSRKQLRQEAAMKTTNVSAIDMNPKKKKQKVRS